MGSSVVVEELYGKPLPRVEVDAEAVDRGRPDVEEPVLTVEGGRSCFSVLLKEVDGLGG